LTGVGFQPDLVWYKDRSSGSQPHQIVDAVRGYGTSAYRSLRSDSTRAEQSNASNASEDVYYGNIQSLNSDGFTIGGTSVDNVNKTNDAYVAWNWKANGAGSSNTAGSITSTVSANTTSGFSIVRWDGNGAGAAATIGHGLGVAPKMIINKGIDGTLAWSVYHASVGNTARLTLNSTDAVDTSSGWWNNTTPTSTVFTVGSTINQATPYDYVAYCFAEVAGYSRFGSYTGNGSTDGPFIYTGFRPAYVLFKLTSGIDSWMIYDAVRNTYNAVNNQLYPNYSSAEYSADSRWYVDFVSNGFKLRGTDALLNGNGSTYIYAAFAENPFKYSLAR
jgi:hypothetical protein